MKWRSSWFIPLFVLACSEDPSGPRIASIEVSGNDQVGVVGQPLPVPVAIEVISGQGKPLPNEPISWQTEHGTLVAPPAATDIHGRAAVLWVLDSIPGVRRLEATVGGQVVEFSATAEPDAPARIAVMLRGGETPPWTPGAPYVFSALHDQVGVDVLAWDRFNNPLRDLKADISATGAAVYLAESESLVAMHPGPAVLRVRAAGASDSVAIEVTPQVALFGVMDGDNWFTAIGETHDFRIALFDRNGNDLAANFQAQAREPDKVEIVQVLNSSMTVRSRGRGSSWVILNSAEARDSLEIIVQQEPWSAELVGNGQLGYPERALPERVGVRYLDRNGYGVPGRAPWLTGFDGDGSFTSPEPSDTAGYSYFDWTLGRGPGQRIVLNDGFSERELVLNAGFLMGRVHGRVVVDSGFHVVPLANVRVSAVGDTTLETVTDANGRYEFYTWVGRYSFTALDTIHFAEPPSFNEDVDTADTELMDLYGQVKEQPLRFEVFVDRNGNEVQDAGEGVDAEVEIGGRVIRVTAGTGTGGIAWGEYERYLYVDDALPPLDLVQGATVRVRAGTGHTERFLVRPRDLSLRRFVVSVDQPDTVLVTAREDVDFEIQVRDELGNPVGHARLYVEDEFFGRAPTLFWEATSREGAMEYITFPRANLPPGDYPVRLTIKKDGWPTVTITKVIRYTGG